MHHHLKRVLRVGVAAQLGMAALAGCTDAIDETESGEAAAVASENGFTMNGFTMNGFTMNGFTMNGFTMNGFTMNGLTATNGLSSTSGLMTTAGGRDIVAYTVKCALPQGRSVTKPDQYGMSHTFEGALGVAPELENGPCDVDCQERISACLLAHVNNSGTHIGIWLASEGTIGWGQNPAYPYQEGSFFGNLFPQNWTGYYCNGRDYDVGAVPGRLGTALSSSVYVNPYGNVGCTASGQCTAHGTDGFDRCTTSTKSWNHVVTAWRNFDPSTAYKVCNYAAGPSGTKCLGVVGGSTVDGALVELRTFSGAPGQTWQVVQFVPGKYRLVNVTSGKSLDQDPSKRAIQKTFGGLPSQQYLVQSLGASGQIGRYQLKPASNTTTGLFVPSTNDGTIVATGFNLSIDTSKWVIQPVGPLPPR